MEHKLITGGSQWLPFARSRIKALRALGLPYACQKYEIDGARIEVRIAGEHEYIRLESGAGPFGGVTRDGTLVEILASSPVTNYTLRAFKPTKGAIKYTSFKPRPKVPEFHDEDRLGVLVAGHVEPTKQGDSQYKHVSGSMYSGRMAKLVQLLLGYGKMATPTPYPNEDEIPTLAEEDPPYQDLLSGVRVRYDHRWARCHGVVVAQDDSIWLVEISQVNGVIAMPLPTMSGDVVLPEIRKRFGGVLEIEQLFGGVPSGGTFPADVAKAIEDGKVIRLASVAAMAPIYSKSSYSSDMGWTFPDNGRVAYNTCRGPHPTEMNWYQTKAKSMAYLYRLDITISGGENPSGSAVLTLQEERWACAPQGPFNSRDQRNSAWSCPFVFQDSAHDPSAPIDTSKVVYVDYSPDPLDWAEGYPIFVRHRLDEVDIVRIKSDGVNIGAGVVSTDFKVSSGNYIHRIREFANLNPGSEQNETYTTTLYYASYEAYGGTWATGARDAFAAASIGSYSWSLELSFGSVDIGDNPFGPNGSGTITTDTFPANVPKPHVLDWPGRPKTLAAAYAIYLPLEALGLPNPAEWVGPSYRDERPMYLALPEAFPEAPTGSLSKEVIKIGALPRSLPETGFELRSRLTWTGALDRGYLNLQRYPRFYIRHSVFGPSFHAMCSEDYIFDAPPDPPGYGVQKFFGPLLKDETPTNLPFYSFVGYLT